MHDKQKRRTKSVGVPLRIERLQDLLNVLVPHEERQVDIGAFVADEPPAL